MNLSIVRITLFLFLISTAFETQSWAEKKQIVEEGKTHLALSGEENAEYQGGHSSFYEKIANAIDVTHVGVAGVGLIASAVSGNYRNAIRATAFTVGSRYLNLGVLNASYYMASIELALNHAVRTCRKLGYGGLSDYSYFWINLGYFMEPVQSSFSDDDVYLDGTKVKSSEAESNYRFTELWCENVED